MSISPVFKGLISFILISTASGFESIWYLFLPVLIGLLVGGVWRLSVWGAIRKVEKTILPDIEAKIQTNEDRRIRSIKDLHEKRESMYVEFDSRIDNYRTENLRLYHEHEIMNTRLTEQVTALKSDTALLMSKIEEVDKRLESRIEKTENVIMKRLEENQVSYRDIVTELKKEIRSLRDAR